MSDSTYYAQEESSLAAAWARAFLKAFDAPRHAFSPFQVSILHTPQGTPGESEELRHALDSCLEAAGHQEIHTVANTIFPESLWKRSGGDRERFFAKYIENLPDYVSMASDKNCHGLYFARLIGFGVNPKTGEPEAHLPQDRLRNAGNQLEFIISTCKKGAQRMALQVAVYDPVRDQTSGRRGFPCLQHATFVPDFETKTLSMNAFYATQQLFVKAYGNWLGLSRLGAFIASQTGLRFHRLTCFVGLEKMDGEMSPKSGPHLEQLKNAARAVVEADQRTHIVTPSKVEG